MKVPGSRKALGSNHRNEYKYIKKSSSSEPLGSDIEIWYVAFPKVFQEVCSNEGPRVQDDPGPGGLRFET